MIFVGRNEMHLNAATMHLIVWDYLRRKTINSDAAPEVTGFKYDSATDMFVVTLKGIDLTPEVK